MKLVEGVASVDDLEGFLDRLDAVGADHGVTVQAFDARYVVDCEHLARAVDLADRAFDRGENVARDRGVELLLYAAGRRQIEEALTMGVSEGERPVIVLVDHPEDVAEAEAGAAAEVRELLDDEPTLDETDVDLVRGFFDVSDRELEAAGGDLAAVVHERVALLDVEK